MGLKTITKDRILYKLRDYADQAWGGVCGVWVIALTWEFWKAYRKVSKEGVN